MKTVVAVLLTAVISAGGARAYDVATVTPATVASLQARVTALESFNRNCLRRYQIHLTENSDRVMVWGIGLPTTHAARFYGLPDTAVPALYCM